VKNQSLNLLITPLLVAAFVYPSGPLHADQSGIGQPLAKQAVLSVLTCKLDTKKSNVGDPVTAKTLNPLKLNDGSVLPVGSILAGKVTKVQPKSSGGAVLAVNFDRVEKKDSGTMPVHGLLVAVAPAPTLSDGGGSTNDLPLGSGGDSKGRIAAATGTSVSGDSNALPPIQPGSSIRGVTLGTMPSSDGSSVLQSTEKDIKLENGTRLEIGLTAPQ
jgi:hypothetical protein